MTVRQTDPDTIAHLVTQLENAIKRAKSARKKLKELLINHAGRISANESDIQAGKDKLVDHEQRISALENP